MNFLRTRPLLNWLKAQAKKRKWKLEMEVYLETMAYGKQEHIPFTIMRHTPVHLLWNGQEQ